MTKVSVNLKLSQLILNIEKDEYILNFYVTISYLKKETVTINFGNFLFKNFTLTGKNLNNHTNLM